MGLTINNWQTKEATVDNCIKQATIIEDDVPYNGVYLLVLCH